MRVTKSANTPNKKISSKLQYNFNLVFPRRDFLAFSICGQENHRLFIPLWDNNFCTTSRNYACSQHDIFPSHYFPYYAYSVFASNLSPNSEICNADYCNKLIGWYQTGPCRQLIFCHRWRSPVQRFIEMFHRAPQKWKGKYTYTSRPTSVCPVMGSWFQQPIFCSCYLGVKKLT